MHSPRQPKDNYQGREQQLSCPSAPACPCLRLAAPSAAPPRPPRQGLCRGWHVPVSRCLCPWSEIRQHVPGGTSLPPPCGCHTGAHAGHCFGRAFEMIFFSLVFFFTTELTVIATSRDIGYRFQTETRQLHAFPEQNKTGNLK